jgi:hypothetical protein
VKTRLTGPARQQADRIDRWWRENRLAARDLFARELSEARALLAEAPDVGRPFTKRQAFASAGCCCLGLIITSTTK